MAQDDGNIINHSVQATAAVSAGIIGTITTEQLIQYGTLAFLGLQIICVLPKVFRSLGWFKRNLSKSKGEANGTTD